MHNKAIGKILVIYTTVSHCKKVVKCGILTDMKKRGGEVIEILDETDTRSNTSGTIWLHFYYTSGGYGTAGLVAAEQIWPGYLDHADLFAAGADDILCRRIAVLPSCDAPGEAEIGSRGAKGQAGGVLQARLMGGML